MSFNNTDMTALKKAADAGLVYETIYIENKSINYFYVRISGLNKNTEATSILTGALEALARLHEKVQIHLDIDLEDTPAFVIRAIESLAGFGMFLIVTHKDKCSHPPSDPLESQLQAAVNRIVCRGMLWHPVEKQLVESRPFKGY